MVSRSGYCDKAGQNYHPEEIGFGGSDVYFDWNEEGWIMLFEWDKDNIQNVKRFLAMRKAGYPVFCPGIKEEMEGEEW